MTDEHPDERPEGSRERAAPLFSRQRGQLDDLLLRRDRLPHALLIAGPPGIGKSRFALALAQGLLCEALDGSSPLAACGHCASCRWFVAGHHPDFHAIGLLAPGEDKPANEVSIDRIRELDDFARLSPFRGGRRVIAIDPADALNAASSNALLKLLEEPGPATHLLLVAARPERLAATIRSRTQRLDVASPSTDEAVAWLTADGDLTAEQARTLLGWMGGAPLHARMLADPAVMTAHRTWLAAIASLPDTAVVTVADRFGTADIVASHGLLLRWVTDLARVKAGAGPKFFPDAVGRLQQLAGRCSSIRLTQVAETLQQQAALVRHPLNPRLFLEEAFAQFAEAFAADSRSASEPAHRTER
ncbi:MAG: DNA polymerase III subunit delta' [Burkholderiaceae bacterium]